MCTPKLKLWTSNCWQCFTKWIKEHQMKFNLLSTSLQSRAFAALLSALTFCGSSARAADVPEFMKEFVNEDKPASKEQVAFDDIYALNDEMFNIYEKSISIY